MEGNTQEKEWLPSCSTDRTDSPKTGWELTPVCTRAYDKVTLSVRDLKPAVLAQISKISQRLWHQSEQDQEREDPILTGMRYLRLFEDGSVNTYAQAAEILGVSRQRVYQMVSMVTAPPATIATDASVFDRETCHVSVRPASSESAKMTSACGWSGAATARDSEPPTPNTPTASNAQNLATREDAPRNATEGLICTLIRPPLVRVCC